MNIEAHKTTYFVEAHQQHEGKPYVVLLHGFMGSGRAFKSLIPLLTSCCNPVTVDLLGHGKTEGAASPERFIVDHQIEDLNQIIREFFDAPPCLYGYSMGGRLALRYALAYSKNISGLILESTHPGLQTEREINQRKKIDEERAQYIEDNFLAFLEEWQALPIFQNGISLPDKKLEHYRAIQRRQSPEQMAHSLRGFGAAQMPSVEKKLVELNLPVLLLAGQADLKYAQIARNMQKKIPNSLLSIIPNAGHRVHIEHPKACASEIEFFINQNLPL